MRKPAGFVLMAVLVASAVGYYQQRDIPTEEAPSLKGRSLDGQYLDLQRMTARGPVLIYFWATWCPYCRVVSPAVSDLSVDHQVLSVAMQSGSDSEVVQYLRRNDLQFPTINDPDGALSNSWGIRVTPTIVIVDSSGNVRWVTSGATSKWGLKLRLMLTDSRLNIRACYGNFWNCGYRASNVGCAAGLCRSGPCPRTGVAVLQTDRGHGPFLQGG
ncbi:protein disulfide oxidoreductase [Microbulbifer rhizosphaerae]|uniref:Thiol-disulfide isomerase/thioredoxin n=1 Tax=Microbulbifer rhizosphaerae TaxID=1562603 RepID=A0A7W4ZAF0_9GAMM|nr:protein disulfide oxidoreductase [Microbulbifer rhizosphaerae]MBB3062682.1 thiol-disulfide isomerase/thioredoxin [Microbulbifer rhizosphaerae]